MKIFSDNHYPPARHLCSTDPCTVIYIYPDAIVLEALDLFSTKFSVRSSDFSFETHKRKKTDYKIF